MSSLTSSLHIILDKETAQITKSFFYYVEKDRSKKIMIPVGFETDLASIPKIFRFFISYLGRHNKAAVIHDFLYNKQSNNYNLTRKQSDDIFLDAMRILNVPFFRRYAMYLGVRIGGAFKFKKR